MTTSPEQIMFDHAVRSIIKQGKPGFDPDKDACCYFVPDDETRCAIGHCLSEDDARALGDQGYCASSILEDVVSFLNLDHDPNPVFADMLQNAHDSAARETQNNPVDFIPLFLAEAREVAINYELDPQVCDQPETQT